MGWGSALRSKPADAAPAFSRPYFEPEVVDLSRLVSLDFETYYDDDYTLRKMSTSEYVRDARFQALMCGIKVGNRAVKIVPGPKIASELAKISWATHSLLAHHAHFDGLILSHHYKIQPKKIYCSLSMARALHSNDIGAGLDEVSRYYSGEGKLETGTEDFKGLTYKQLAADKVKWANASKYCGNDVLEMLRVFLEMLPRMPRDEMDLIDRVVRMFTDPVLKLDEPRCRAEYEREIAAKRALLFSLADLADDVKLSSANKKKIGPNATDEDAAIARAKQLIGSAKFADLLRAEGVEPPVKISPAWIKTPPAERKPEKKWAYAFAKTDLEFMELLGSSNERLRNLVEARLSVKSSGIETRAGRLLKLGANGASMPVYYRYAAAHTLRLGGGDKTNFQNLKRGGELRKAIKATPGHVLVVADSGQIEARTNGWLWEQDDLLDDFRAADAGTDRDAYCKFADTIYGRTITKDKDPDERFIGKVAVLMLGYQAAADKFRNTLALGTMGPAVFLEPEICQLAVNNYRRKNFKIKAGWKRCEQIIRDMAAGRSGSYKCISWEKNIIYLPDGMFLKYPGLRQKKKDHPDDWDEWVYDRKGEEAKIYGGLLCENIVQALAKIIVMGQLLKIARVHRVVMTTHDEVVAMVKKSQGPKALDFMLKTMRIAPAWCADIPLNAEGGFAVEYSK